jgi:cleavage and polyadenylation specificity factor subunit 4
MIEFDFERDVEKMLPKLLVDDGFKFDQKQRTIVCRHWLLGLCYKGEQCSHLHKLDKSKMPPCKHGNLCKIKNCPLKHIAEEELEECIFYKQGFCPSGPKCSRRHVRKTPEECPVEASFDTTVGTTIGGKKTKLATPNDNFKVTLCSHWLQNGVCPFNNDCHFAHGEDQINEGFQANSEFLQDSDIYDPTASRTDAPLMLPFPTSAKFSCFILQAPDLRSLSVSKRRNVWAVPMRMMAELNSAFMASEHVLLFMCVRPLRAIYGVLKMTGLIPPMPQLGAAMSAEFPIVWIRTKRLALRPGAQRKLGSAGMLIGRSASDGR